jgi:hypothetical protein
MTKHKDNYLLSYWDLVHIHEVDRQNRPASRAAMERRPRDELLLPIEPNGSGGRKRISFACERINKRTESASGDIGGWGCKKRVPARPRVCSQY